MATNHSTSRMCLSFCRRWLNKHRECRTVHLEVMLFDADSGEEVLRTDVPPVLDYVANDIYWNEEGDWSDANRAEVRVM